MKKRGSITVYLCLMLLVMISVLGASFVSVRVAAGRMQCANASDQAMFSMFAQYDRDLFDRFDVFFIDGSCGGSGLHADKLRERYRKAADYILHPNQGMAAFLGNNLLRLQTEDCSICGYTLATDVNGSVFASQAVDFMKETLGIQGVSLLLMRTQDQAAKTSGQEAAGASVKEAGADTDYAEVKAISDEAKEKDRLEKEREAEETGSPPSATEAEIAADNAEKKYVNPLPDIAELRRRTILSLVVSDMSSLSDRSVDSGELLSGREKESGVGVIDVPPGIGGFYERLLFDEYIMQHFGNYTDPEKAGPLLYSTEYILHGKKDDRANLEAQVIRLLAVREAVNLVALYTDPTLRSELSAVSAGIAAMLFIPEASDVIQAILAVGWAFCESIVDVTALLRGMGNAICKDSSTWQVPVESIAALLSGGAQSLVRNVPGGITYEDYLRVDMLLKGGDDLIVRTMDMAEGVIRAGGRSAFRLDCCVESLSVEMKVRSEDLILLVAEKKGSYREYTRKQES